MSILIGQYEFDGPVSNFADVPSVPGLYAIIHKENHDLLLVDIDQSSDLARDLKAVVPKLREKMVVLLPCAGSDRRKEILHELVREFEFDEDGPVQAAPARRAETNSFVGAVI